MAKRFVAITVERCKGCAFSVEFCPTQVLTFSSAFNSKCYHPPFVAAPDKSSGCDLCGMYCPDFASPASGPGGDPGRRGDRKSESDLSGRFRHHDPELWAGGEGRRLKRAGGAFLEPHPLPLCDGAGCTRRDVAGSRNALPTRTAARRDADHRAGPRASERHSHGHPRFRRSGHAPGRRTWPQGVAEYRHGRFLRRRHRPARRRCAAQGDLAFRARAHRKGESQGLRQKASSTPASPLTASRKLATRGAASAAGSGTVSKSGPR